MFVAGVEDGAIGAGVALKKPRISPAGKAIVVSCCCVVCGRASWRLFQDGPRKCEESFFCEETKKIFFLFFIFFHEESQKKTGEEPGII